MTDAERIERALDALLGCVSRDRMGAWLDLPQARALLEQLLEGRECAACAEFVEHAAEAERSHAATMTALSTAQQRVEALEGALREIVKCESPFFMDRLEHAHAAVAHCQEIALRSLLAAKEKP